MNPTIPTLLKYSQLQMAAEALFEFKPINGQSPAPGLLGSYPTIDAQFLVDGNARANKFTPSQATEFATQWSVVEHVSNTTTGFSGTLFKSKTTGELVISFRSTEFVDDAARDNQATNTMEILREGFAFGQISDMQAWYGTLLSSGKIPAGSPLTVTGYSLGGHLATAFNLLYPNAAQATFTFNGAGVGVLTDGWSLSQVMAEFNSRIISGANADQFADASVRSLYDQIRGLFSGHTQVTNADVQVTLSVIKLRLAVASPAVTQQLLILQGAVKHIGELVAEAERISAGIPSGDANANGPLQVSTGQMAATGLDYQLAVGIAGAHTTATNTVFNSGGVVAYAGRVIASNPIPTLFDVYAAQPPSGVANSQIHYGTSVPVWIEDQPTLRGLVANEVYKATRAGQITEPRLLVDNFSLNNFGDAHSLVLLVDSLSVQSVFTALQPDISPSSLNSMLGAVSNVRVETGYVTPVGVNNQGVADGDSLEAMVNSLGRTLGLTSAQGWKQLHGDTTGGKWAETSDNASNGTTGRESLHGDLSVIQQAIQSLSGKLLIQPALGNLSSQAQTRSSFEDTVALEALSPFVLQPAGQQGSAELQAYWEQSTWAHRYQMWSADKASIAAGGNPENYSDQWYADRAAMLQALTRQGSLNVPYPVGSTNTNYIDATLALTVTQRMAGLGVNAPANRMWFGGAGNEGFEGTDNALGDHLYGGEGADTLRGLSGKDWLDGGADADALEGGADGDSLNGGAGADILAGGTGNDLLKGGSGTDTYRFIAGDGSDRIHDSDGLGSIVVTGAGPIDGSGTTKKTAFYWETADQAITYTLVPGSAANETDLIVKVAATGNVITIQDWSEAKNLGISLPGTVTAPPPNPALSADLLKQNNGITYTLIANKNYLGAGSDPGAADVLNGTAGDEKMEGLLGNDGLYGHDGDDRLDGNEGADLLMGGVGADVINGGDGNDVIFGSAIGYIATPSQVGFTPFDTTGSDVAAQGFSWVATRALLQPGQEGDLLLFRPITISGAITSPVWQDGNEFFVELDGNVIDGGAGDDYIAAGTGNDVVQGGTGNDDIIGMDKADLIDGGDGDDYMFGDGTQDQDDQGRYTLLEFHGADTMLGGDGQDIMLGQGADDELFGGDGNDKLWGDDQVPTETPSEHGSDLRVPVERTELIWPRIAAAKYLRVRAANETTLVAAA